MALTPNGEEIITIQTPDGRSVQVPASLANAFAGAQPVAPPAPVPMQQEAPLAPAAAAIPSGADLDYAFTSIPEEQRTPAPAARVVTPEGFEQPITPAGFETKPAQQAKPKAAPAAAPSAPQDPNVAMLEGASDMQDEANANVADAQFQQGLAEAGAQIALADARQEANTAIDQVGMAEQKKAQQALEDAVKTDTQVTGLIKKHADTKIDRTHDHEALATIGQVLALIGMAYNKQSGPNPATEMYLKSIDRKVAGQMGDLDKLEKTIGYKKEDIKRLRETMSDNMAMRNALVAAECEKQARIMDEMALRTSSEKVKASAMTLAMQTRERGAEAKAAAVTKQVDYNQKLKFHNDGIKQQIADRGAANWRHSSSLKENARQFDLDFSEKVRNNSMDYEIALGKANAERGVEGQKQMLEFRKLNEEQAIGTVNSGETILTAEGYKMMDQAAALESKAQEIIALGATTPQQEQQVQALRQQAASIRGTAKTVEAFRAGSASKEIRKQYAATQNVATLVDDIKGLYEKNGPSVTWKNEDQQALEEKRMSLMFAIKEATQAGALDKGLVAAIEKQIGANPNDVTVGFLADKLGIKAGTDPKGVAARLDSLSQGFEMSFANTMRANKWDGDPQKLKLIFRKEKPKAGPNDEDVKKLGSETAASGAAAADDTDLPQRAWARGGQIVSGVLGLDEEGPFGKSTSERRGENIRANASLSYPTLTKEQGKALDNIVTQAQKNPDARTQLLNLASNKDPDIASAAVRAAKQIPEVYSQLRSSTDPKVKEQIRIADSLSDIQDRGTGPQFTPEQSMKAAKLALKEKAIEAVSAQTPLAELASRAGALNDDGAYKEISRRAGSGDAQARTVLGKVQEFRAKSRGAGVR